MTDMHPDVRNIKAVVERNFYTINNLETITAHEISLKWSKRFQEEQRRPASGELLCEWFVRVAKEYGARARVEDTSFDHIIVAPYDNARIRVRQTVTFYEGDLAAAGLPYTLNVPAQEKFDLGFVVEDGAWKLDTWTSLTATLSETE